MPKDIKYTGAGVETFGMEHLVASDTTWSWYVVEAMETCCDSLQQCDVQKRAELKNTLIAWDIRNCECEKQFRKCFETPKLFDLIGLAETWILCSSLD